MSHTTRTNTILLLLLAIGSIFTACDNRKSYADLLSDENKSVNRYLADHILIDHVPADSVFQHPDPSLEGEALTEALKTIPYYQIDDEGNIYMQVISIGNGDKVQTGDRVYFRFMRYPIAYYKPGEIWYGEGNLDNMSSTSTYFVYGDPYNSMSQKWGEGLQYPLQFLPYGSEVNLVVKSQQGPSEEIANVAPYMYHIRYNKPQV